MPFSLDLGDQATGVKRRAPCLAYRQSALGSLRTIGFSARQ